MTATFPSALAAMGKREVPRVDVAAGHRPDRRLPHRGPRRRRSRRPRPHRRGCRGVHARRRPGTAGPSGGPGARPPRCRGSVAEPVGFVALPTGASSLTIRDALMSVTMTRTVSSTSVSLAGGRAAGRRPARPTGTDPRAHRTHGSSVVTSMIAAIRCISASCARTVASSRRATDMIVLSTSPRGVTPLPPTPSVDARGSVEVRRRVEPEEREVGHQTTDVAFPPRVPRAGGPPSRQARSQPAVRRS